MTIDASGSGAGVTVNPGSDGNIKLKVKSRGELGDSELTYYFSICLNQTVADRRLVIER